MTEAELINLAWHFWVLDPVLDPADDDPQVTAADWLIDGAPFE